MISSGTLRAGRVPRSTHAHPWHKRIKVIIATLLLAAGFVFAGASTATAATAAPAFMNSHVTNPPCRGDKPGICPNPSATWLNEQEPVRQSHNRSTTQQSNE